MSTGIRCTARKASSARPIRATTMVIGRLSAPRTKRMLHLLKSLARLGEEGLYIAASCEYLEHRPPDVQSGQSIIDLGLHEQALRLGDVIDRGQPRLIPRGRLLKG